MSTLIVAPEVSSPTLLQAYERLRRATVAYGVELELRQDFGVHVAGERQGQERAQARASFADSRDHLIASDLEMAAHHREAALEALREADRLLWQASNRALARRWPLRRLAAFIGRPQKTVKRWLQTPDLVTLEE